MNLRLEPEQFLQTLFLKILDIRYLRSETFLYAGIP